MLRILTPLSDELEALVHKTIGCCIAVHKVLGPGLLEGIYSRAVCIELSRQAIPFEREVAIPVRYCGELLCHHRLDILVAEQLVLEIKAVDHLSPVHRAQLLSYLRISQRPVGLLINFNVVVLQEGIKRVIL
jgi:GxxExxY protein